LFRHDVVKVVEPDEDWLPYGIRDDGLAWTRDDAIGRTLVDRARILSGLDIDADGVDRPVADEVVPYPLGGAAVGLYHRGHAAGGISLAGAPGDTPLDTLLRRATIKAVQRYAGDDNTGPGVVDRDATVMVTLLHDP